MTARREPLQSSRAAKASQQPRDQEESAFSGILAALLSQLPRARAAALVDREGETVDYAAVRDPFRVRVTAAHWRIVLEHGAVLRSLEGLQWLTVCCGRRSYLVHALPQGYALVVAFARGARLLGWDRRVATCARALCQEAGWVRVEEDGVDAAAGKRQPERPEQGGQREVLRWFPVEVVTDERHRPSSIRVGGRLHPLEILGTIVRRTDRTGTPEPHAPEPHAAASGVGRGERAWRVRLEKGIEATIVRRLGGTWYADEPVHSLMQPR